MKISTREVASIISSPPPRFCIYLLYGQDNGLMAERSKMLERHFTNGDNDPSAVVSLASAEVGRDKTLLCDNLNAIPMFGGKRVVLLSGQGSEIWKKRKRRSRTQQRDRTVTDIPTPLDVICDM